METRFRQEEKKKMFKKVIVILYIAYSCLYFSPLQAHNSDLTFFHLTQYLKCD